MVKEVTKNAPVVPECPSSRVGHGWFHVFMGPNITRHPEHTVGHAVKIWHTDTRLVIPESGEKKKILYVLRKQRARTLQAVPVTQHTMKSIFGFLAFAFSVTLVVVTLLMVFDMTDASASLNNESNKWMIMFVKVGNFMQAAMLLGLLTATWSGRLNVSIPSFGRSARRSKRAAGYSSSDGSGSEAPATLGTF